MTLLEYAEKTSPIPLTAWQREFLQRHDGCSQKEKAIDITYLYNTGKQQLIDIINQFYEGQMTTVYCQGTKKIGIPCRRYLGKVEGKAELLCPICKTVNVVENGKITVKECRNYENKSRR